ncbi:MAG: hypothetical protein IPK26_13540 [Planctomycetes bacterium]|nr:hypothetical protein [Planctomycetota bacterium]
MVHLLEVDVANAVSGVGNNPSCIAWDGTDLFVGGFNGAVTVQAVAINKLTGALGATPTWGTPFGQQVNAPVNRGYINLAIDSVNGRLVAGYDPGTVDNFGLTAWDLSGMSLWSKPIRGSSGLEFDPGFPGGNPALGAGVAWGAFNQPGRALQDAALGTDIWTVANGMNVLVPGAGGFLRDWDFDPATGDIYIRASNDVFVGRRTGDNTTVTSVLVDLVDANLVALQNIGFLHTPNGSLVLFNDRATGAINQPFAGVVKAVRPDGTPETIDWGTFAPNNGAAAYDFSYDQATNTLALCDYFLRKVHIFAVSVPAYYPYGAGCPGQGGFVPALTGSGQISALGGPLTLNLAAAAPLSAGFFAFGFEQGNQPLGNGCTILVQPITSFYLGPIITGPGSAGTGTGTVNFNVPPGFSGYGVTMQSVVLENISAASIVLSNGLQLRIP